MKLPALFLCFYIKKGGIKMISVTAVIVLCAGAAVIIALGIFLSRWDAKRYERMAEQEKQQRQDTEGDAKKKK